MATQQTRPLPELPIEEEETGNGSNGQQTSATPEVTAEELATMFEEPTEEVPATGQGRQQDQDRSTVRLSKRRRWYGNLWRFWDLSWLN